MRDRHDHRRRLAQILAAPIFLVLSITLLALPPVFADEETESAVNVRQIRVEGLEDSDPRLILRELPFHSGTAWRSGMKALSERRLRNLGLFRNIVVHAPDEAGDVLIEVHERWSLWILPRLNRNDDGTSGLGVNVDEYNLWGLGHHLRVAVDQDTGKNFSTSNGTSYSLGYQWPKIADTRFGFAFGYHQGNSVYVGFDAGQSVANYIEQRHELLLDMSYGLGPDPGEGWTTHGGLVRSNSSFSFIDGDPLPDVGDNRITSVIAGLEYKLIDDHITWLSGERFEYEIRQGVRALGSDQASLTHTISWRKYRHIGRGRTLNFRLKGGQIAGDSQRDARFDLGNRNEIRGYFPGELLATRFLFGTVEGRFPSEPDSNFVYVAFADIGHLSDRGQDPFGKKVITGFGGGIRWTLRWLVHGVLRVDLAYGLASNNLRLYLGTGQAF